MTKKKKKNNFKQLKVFLPYFLVTIATLAIVALGSIDKKNAEINLSLDAFVANDYKISVDQLSELYVVADISSAMSLASAQDTASNYVISSTIRNSGLATSGKIEKPNITDIGERAWVVQYTVQDGESMNSIASRFGISTDQIRWSNGLKTTNVSAGTVLYLPRESGIVYTVKSGDTVDSIVSKYGSNTEEITIFNDLDATGLVAGNKIFIKGGSLPEKERPEYVPPVVNRTPSIYSYTYLGSSSSRQDLKILYRGFYDPAYAYPNPNPGVRGNCTWYAWYWRATSPLSLGALNHNGRHARTWNRDYAYRGVGRTPVVGAVFQTPYGGGGYGHVGVVTGINADGSIVVQEMNYAGYSVVTEAIIPANYVGNFNYIY